ncbi:MAG: hypothetical protein ACOXZH_07720 [Bacteroidales bacterium]|jgi:hypothetical protein|nr:hypothetical protein [Bacteroidales bacterium]
MKKKILLILLILQIFIGYIFAQKSIIFINELKILDSAFYQVLDTVMFYEKQSIYYTNSLSYGIFPFKNITTNGDSILCIKIEGYPDKDIFIEDNRAKGYLLYKNHYFFVTNNLSLLNKFALPTKCGKNFDYYLDFIASEDDRWAIYIFIYYCGKFVLYDW